MLDKQEGYLGSAWGSSEADFRAKGFDIYRAFDMGPHYPGLIVCSVTLKEGPIPCMADFAFRDGALVSVYLRFRPSDFKLMGRRLAYRYGRARLEEPDRLLWKGEQTSILLLRSSSTPDMASAYLICRAEEEVVMASANRPSGETADG